MTKSGEGENFSSSLFVVEGIRCGLKLEEIYEYTPRELYYYFLARIIDEDVKMQTLAWQTAIIVSYTNRLKKPIKPDDLYKSPRNKKELNPEKLKKEFYDIVKRFEEKPKEKGGE